MREKYVENVCEKTKKKSMTEQRHDFTKHVWIGNYDNMKADILRNLF